MRELWKSTIVVGSAAVVSLPVGPGPALVVAAGSDNQAFLSFVYFSPCDSIGLSLRRRHLRCRHQGHLMTPFQTACWICWNWILTLILTLILIHYRHYRCPHDDARCPFALRQWHRLLHHLGRELLRRHHRWRHCAGCGDPTTSCLRDRPQHGCPLEHWQDPRDSVIGTCSCSCACACAGDDPRW